MTTILSQPCPNDQTTIEHPGWCDPRECHIADLRTDDLGLLRVHALTVWETIYGRSVELIQTEALTEDLKVVRRHQPMVKGHGSFECGFEADDADEFGAAWIRAGRLARTESLPFTQDWVREALIKNGQRSRWSAGVVTSVR